MHGAFRSVYIRTKNTGIRLRANAGQNAFDTYGGKNAFDTYGGQNAFDMYDTSKCLIYRYSIGYPRVKSTS